MVVFDSGEAEVEAEVTEGEAFVVDAKELENGGLEVVDVDRVFGDVEAEVVGLAEGDAGLDAAAGHPHGEGLGVVVATVAAFEGGTGFYHGSASKFSAPDDQSVFEHAAFLEILDEGGTGLVGFLGLAFNVAFDIGVGIPTGMIDLDEADTSLGETTGQENIGGEAGFAGLGSVEVEGLLGFLGKVHQFRCTGLHPVSHFIGFDPCGDLWVPHGLGTFLVEFFEKIEGLTLGFLVDALGVGNMEDGVSAFPEGDTLVFGWQEAGIP